MTADDPTSAAAQPLSRPALGLGTPPVRMVHLGLGGFFRAHQAWYTAHASDAEDWGVAAWTGRSTDLAQDLSTQGGLYTLVTRRAGGDATEVVPSLVEAHPGGDVGSLVRHLADPGVHLVTLTVTEAGYRRRPDGSIDLDSPDVAADLVLLAGPSADAAEGLRTAPGRLVAGLRARHRSAAGPLTVVPCDNLPDNATALARVVRELVTATGDTELGAWVEEQVGWVTTMVDRITPATTAADVTDVQRLTGRADRAPVVTEPFSEWVIGPGFVTPRPAWDTAGATLVDDVTPYETRKLWLLNGGHSLLAYLGGALGHATVADAMGDTRCREALTAWWDEAAPVLTRHTGLETAEVDAYRAALVERFTNPRIRHLLAQIATDGSQKLPVRILTTLETERAAGRMPEAAVTILAAWVVHLRGGSTPVRDAAADRFTALAAGDLGRAVPAVLGGLQADLADDPDLVAAVRSGAAALETR